MMIAMRTHMTQAGPTKWAADSLRAAFCAAFVLSVASCSRLIDDNRVAFGGIYFSSKVQSEKAHKENFEIFVRKATQNITAAREAGEYEATIYCVRNFGTSDVDWVYGPDDVAPQFDDDALYLKGTCRV